MQLRPGKSALSENPIIFGAVQYAPLKLKRLIPKRAVDFVRRWLSPRTSSPAPFASAPAEARGNPSFDWLGPFFASVGLDGEPAAIFAALRAAGYPVYETPSAAERVAALVRKCGLFDETYYRALAPNLGKLDPALHYVIIGERMGFAPSGQFDPAYYNDRNPNLGRSCLLAHYVIYGRRQGRRPISVAATIAVDTSRVDPTRDTILVVSHEATRTGAPILAYNIVKRLAKQHNVVTVLLSGGNIVSAFERISTAVIGPLERKDWHPVEMDYLVRRLLRHFQFSFALVNSIDARQMMKPLSSSFVPVVALVHEFAEHLKPPGEMAPALGWATEAVFSAERVLDSVRAESPYIDDYRLHLLPQGPPELPPAETAAAVSQLDVRAGIRPAGHENDFVVLGCGTISPRKGVDLFLACAAAVLKRGSTRRFRFVWIGQYLPKDIDNGYSRKLRRYIRWSGISGSVSILEEVADLEPAYKAADAFFLSSRLDPLPNVAIDSMLRELPVVCFADCSGIADILKTDPILSATVVPKLNVEAAATLVVDLAVNEQMRTAIGREARELALATFDMDAYVARLAEIGRNAAHIMGQRRGDFATIERDHSFDTVGFLGPNYPTSGRDEAIMMFIAEAAIPKAGKYFHYRRPAPGFHPHVYAFENKDRYHANLVNPFAHFIRSGKPEGPWKSEVITPLGQDGASAPRPALKAGLHVHFHYPEVCGELLAMIATNRSRCDLLLTTNSARKARTLSKKTANYQGGDVQIITVPNRGRDIGAFLTGLGKDLIQRYEVIGHLHSKRSLFLADRAVGERWRHFIWTNLIGREHAMMDTVLDRMAGDARLGLVFPDDPHLSAWDENLEISEQLAQRLGLEDQLPPFFNFPLGTMFWARPEALAPLFELGLEWDSYPPEPAPIDGTILHALERLLPFVVQHQGYRYATTHVPGVTW